MALTPVLLVGGAVTGVTGVPTGSASTATPARPNIVLILTDDQRVDTLDTMPVVRRELVAKGETFTGVIPTSTCCPSRVSLFTGLFSHNTGVYNNVGPTVGGWRAFHASGHEGATFATALHAAGYRTALFGKYLNGWSMSPQDFVPPGWDDFMAIRSDSPNLRLGSSAYYNYRLTGTEPTQSYGNTPADYSTDVLANLAVDFVKKSVPGGPFFVEYSTTAPHGPMTPAPRDVGTWSTSTPYDNQAVNEAGMSDKPGFMQGLPRVPRAYIDQTQTKTMESLMAVDEGVQRIINAVGVESTNTLFIFMSDNGVMWGEHRLRAKNKPYRWSTEVPMTMRWDGHFTPGTSGGLVANVDVTATMLDAARIPGALAMDGRSVLTSKRSSLVLEAVNTVDHPAYCGIRTQNWLYVRYSGTQGVELYDYAKDPLELHNLAYLPQYLAKREELRVATHRACSPVPPRFAW
ncbi:MAG: sulfatase [Actinomycetes bacterium]